MAFHGLVGLGGPLHKLHVPTVHGHILGGCEGLCTLVEMDNFAQVDDIIYAIQFFSAIRIMVLTAQRHLPSQLLHFSWGVLCSRTPGSSFTASHRILCPGHMPSTQRNMWILLEE